MTEAAHYTESQPTPGDASPAEEAIMHRYRSTARRAILFLTLGLCLAAMTTSAAPHRHGPVTFGNGPAHQHGPAHYGNGPDHRTAPGVYRTPPEAASPRAVPPPPGVASPVIIVSPYLRLDRHQRWRFDHDKRWRDGGPHHRWPPRQGRFRHEAPPGFIEDGRGLWPPRRRP